MRSQWYGDKRDHLKWTALLFLADRENVRHIFHIAMRTDPQPQPFHIHSDAGPLVNQEIFADQVAAYFHHHNDLNAIQHLGAQLNIHIDLYDAPFAHHTRQAYFDDVVQQMHGPRPATLWFFDPDTGIAPGNRPNQTHVRPQELQMAWNAIPEGHFLACYQHARHEMNWHAIARNNFRQALGINNNQVEIFASNDVRDVIVLAARKA